MVQRGWWMRARRAGGLHHRRGRTGGGGIHHDAHKAVKKWLLHARTAAIAGGCLRAVWRRRYRLLKRLH